MRIKRNPKVVHRFVKNRLYVFDDIRMVMHTYNAVGSFIWKQARSPIGEEEIIKKVCQEFAVDTKRATQDIRDFIKEEIAGTKLFIYLTSDVV